MITYYSQYIINIIKKKQKEERRKLKGGMDALRRNRSDRMVRLPYLALLWHLDLVELQRDLR
jgi:hypothetical protein